MWEVRGCGKNDDGGTWMNEVISAMRLSVDSIPLWLGFSWSEGTYSDGVLVLSARFAR